MRRNMFVAVSAVAAAFVIAAGAGAANAPSPSYQLAGFAFGTQNTSTSLAGQATGSTGDRAFWRATVTTAPLTTCSTLGSACGVSGGSVALTSSNGSRVNGTVEGGTVMLSDQRASACGRQQYTLDAAVAAADGTTWQLTAVITQCRFAFRGTCFSLGATCRARSPRGSAARAASS